MLQKHRPYNYTAKYFTVKPYNESTDPSIIQRIFYSKAILQKHRPYNYTAKYIKCKKITNSTLKNGRNIYGKN